MGDRVNVAVQDDGERVYFYGHWSGHIAPALVQQALASPEGRSRWSDGPYLARIVFDYFTERQGGELGFGISTGVLDNEYPIIVVDVDSQTVQFEDEDRPLGCRAAVGARFGFGEYAELELAPGDPWETIEQARGGRG